MKLTIINREIISMSPLIILIVAAVLISSVFAYDQYKKGSVASNEIGMSKSSPNEAVAYFSGGCFWCVESDYKKLPQVKQVISGYMGGNVESPSYEQVSTGTTGHREAVKVLYDPSKTTYRDLVMHLLRHIDPTDSGGSFHDRGPQYTSAIYYQTEEEKQIAEEVVRELEGKKVFSKPIATSIEPAKTFWTAEDYHQNYYLKNKEHYDRYRRSSGRDDFIESVWGKK